MRIVDKCNEEKFCEASPQGGTEVLSAAMEHLLRSSELQRPGERRGAERPGVEIRAREGFFRQRETGG